MNHLNRHDAPCDEDGDKLNFELCIKEGMEQKLNCTLPDISSGEALPPVGKPNNDICLKKEQLTNFIHFGSFDGFTEQKLYQRFGCIAKCQGKYILK